MCFLLSPSSLGFDILGPIVSLLIRAFVAIIMSFLLPLLSTNKQNSTFYIYSRFFLQLLRVTADFFTVTVNFSYRLWQLMLSQMVAIPSQYNTITIFRGKSSVPRGWMKTIFFEFSIPMEHTRRRLFWNVSPDLHVIHRDGGLSTQCTDPMPISSHATLPSPPLRPLKASPGSISWESWANFNISRTDLTGPTHEEHHGNVQVGIEYACARCAERLLPEGILV